MRILSISLSLTVVLLCSHAIGSQFFPANDAELLEAADRVVVGVAAGDRQQMVIRVSEVIKGPTAKEIRTKKWVKTFDVFQSGDRGIFFLQSFGDAAYPFHPRCYLPTKALPRVKMLTEMKRDPAPYLDLAKYPEDDSIVYTLGSLFSGFRATCAEYPRLESAGTVRQYYEYAPWHDKSLVVLKGNVDKNGKAVVSIASAPPNSPLAEFYRKTLLQFANPLNGVTGPYTLTIDARIPRQVGSLQSEDALKYLRDRLESKNPHVVQHAVIALAKMRDLDSVKQVESLMKRGNPTVQHYAKRFLAGARRQERD